MNWYANELLIRDSINDLHNAREMERLARTAQGEDAGIGLEDFLSARALVARITVRASRPDHAPRMNFIPVRADR
ncbi:MAG: hypothetical protein SGJ24_20375 [Chloroflexota bacterium]|nr:hypothetical protein [Chloroflexota bacterium]